MATNLPDDDLLDEEPCNAEEVPTGTDGGTDESDQPHEQSRIIDLFGTVEIRSNYDYEAQRNLS